MSNTNTLKTIFSDIANAIREKEGAVDNIPVVDMATRISSLQTEEKINNSKTIEIIAQNEIKIGDIIYTIGGVNNFQAEEPSLNVITYTNAVFTPDHKMLIISGDFGIKICTVNGTNATYVSDLKTNFNPSNYPSGVGLILSPDGKTLIVVPPSGNDASEVYSINDSVLTYTGSIPEVRYINGVSFSSNRKLLFVNIEDYDYNLGIYPIKIFGVTDNKFSFLNILDADNNGNKINTREKVIFGFSPDGKTMVAGYRDENTYEYFVKVYSINDRNITYINDIYLDDNNTSASVSSITFAPDNSTFIVSRYDSNTSRDLTKVYSISNQEITYISDITLNSTYYRRSVSSMNFSPDGNTLVLGGNFGVEIHSVQNQTFTYVNSPTDDSNVKSVNFSPDGQSLVIAAKKITFYNISNGTFTEMNDISYSDYNLFNKQVYSATFSPDNKLLILTGEFKGVAKAFSVNDRTITYIDDIYAKADKTPLFGTAKTATFSPDGKILVLCGNFQTENGYSDNKTKFYSVNENIITYLGSLKNSDGYDFSYSLSTLAFSPSGNILIVGGNNIAKVYKVDGQTFTYVSEIYADNDNNTLYQVDSIAFSPDGNTLILGGYRTVAKIYSVNGQTVTYVSDIDGLAESNGVFYDEITTIAFSPDGKTLILDPRSYSGIKMYSVNGTQVEYISNIYDNDGYNFSRGAYSITFFDDGKKLLIVPYYEADKIKIYSVEGQNVNYTDEINFNDAEVSISKMAISSDNKLIVLSGDFDNYARALPIYNGEIKTAAEAYAIPGGIITGLPANCTLGFSKSNLALGEIGTARTLGKYKI